MSKTGLHLTGAVMLDNKLSLEAALETYRDAIEKQGGSLTITPTTAGGRHSLGIDIRATGTKRQMEALYDLAIQHAPSLTARDTF